MSIRAVKRIIQARPTVEGAGIFSDASKPQPVRTDHVGSAGGETCELHSEQSVGTRLRVSVPLNRG